MSKPGYSQFGEHLDIDDLVGHASEGYACDVGAYDGKQINNTLHLEERGWQVLCIEANPLVAGVLTMNRKLVKMVACGREIAESRDFSVFQIGENDEGINYSAVSALTPDPDRPAHRDIEPKHVFKVPVFTLDVLLREVGFPRLDVLSIDVEGGESDVLDGFDVGWWSPKVIVVEDWHGGRHRERMQSMGYKLYRRREVNEIYARK